MQFILVVITIEHEFIEFLIFFFSDFFFLSGPDGFNEIDSFSIDSDGEVDKVRILVDDMLNVGDVGKVGVVFSQMKGNSCTSL